MKINITNKEILKTTIGLEEPVRVLVILKRKHLDSLQSVATETSTASALLVEAIHKELVSEAISSGNSSSGIVQPKHIATDVTPRNCYVYFDYSVVVDFKRVHLDHLPHSQPRVIAIRLKGGKKKDTISGILHHFEPILQNNANSWIALLYDLNGYNVDAPFITILPGQPGSGIPIPEYRDSRRRTESSEAIFMRKDQLDKARL